MLHLLSVNDKGYPFFKNYCFKKLTMGNDLFSFYEIKWLEQFPKEFKPVFYGRYVDDIFVLFELAELLFKCRNYFNIYHPENVSFSIEQEQNGKLSLLDIEVSQKKEKL